ncbi:unnamed protein product [Moneuplotes crassus]|uniref:Uncharacterized protein n=1 Tax=Euplotes crassus TaxID=5936 RepID=A0AAD1YBU5_EUPCR|nr:unnamed protein product [Moneuplotes crassus]
MNGRQQNDFLIRKGRIKNIEKLIFDNKRKVGGSVNDRFKTAIAGKMRRRSKSKHQIEGNKPRVFSVGDTNKANHSIHQEDHQRSLASPLYKNGKINLDNSSLKAHNSINTNATRMRFRNRVFSPVEQRRPILKSKNQIQEIRQTSFASKIINKGIRSKPSSPIQNKVINLAARNEKFINNSAKFNTLSQNRSNRSQSSSPKETVFSQERLNKFIQNITKKKDIRYG